MDHFLKLLMLHFVYLELGQAFLILSLPFYLRLLFLFLLGLLYDRLGDILAIVQCLLPGVYLSFLGFGDIRARFYSLGIYAFDLARKLLNHNKITCIFYCFFFFSIQSSPPMLAPSPPNRTHSLFALFFFSRLFE